MGVPAHIYIFEYYIYILIYIYIYIYYYIDVLLYIYTNQQKIEFFLAGHLTLTVPIPDFTMDVLSLSRRKFILLDTFLFEGSNVEFSVHCLNFIFLDPFLLEKNTFH